MKEISASEALKKSKKAWKQLSVQMQPIFRAIDLASSSGDTSITIYGENTSRHNQDIYYFSRDCLGGIIDRLNELGYHTSYEIEKSIYGRIKLTISWGDKDD